MESKWKIKKVKLLELFENIHPWFFLLLHDFLTSLNLQIFLRRQYILLIYKEAASQSASKFFGTFCPAKRGRGSNSLKCKAHHVDHIVRCMFMALFLSWHPFLFCLEADVYFHSVKDLIYGKSG